MSITQSESLNPLRDVLAANLGTHIELRCQMQNPGMTVIWTFGLLATTMHPHVRRTPISEHYALTSAEADALEVLIADHNTLVRQAA